MKHSITLKLVLTLCVLTGCTYISQGFFDSSDRGAKTSAQDQFGDSAKTIVYLNQNWSPSDSLWFYNTTQGSNLMPYKLFLHLEQAHSTELFRSDANMRRFRYLAQSASNKNPDALPVGFVRDTYQNKEYIGLTCAGCHTAQINYQGVGIRIDGAPAYADMESFMLELEQALTATIETPTKFHRLAKNILGHNKQEASQEIHAELITTRDQLRAYNTANKPLNNGQEIRYGYGRLDAFGRIYNRILAHLTPEDPTNANPANAPVNYPQLWDTPQHDFVQWNAISGNASIGALGRNVGEVMGVFATMDLSPQPGNKGYNTSMDIMNLIRLEKHIRKLTSPKWPEQFPKVDEKLAKKGMGVYLKFRCHDCHELINSRDPNRLITAELTSSELLGTDTQTLKNALNYRGKSGYFKGLPIDADDPNTRIIGEDALVLDLVNEAGRGGLVQPSLDAPWGIRGPLRLAELIYSVKTNPVENRVRELNFAPNTDQSVYFDAFKARPLNGIWATAPYLHNGSIPSLYELFLPKCTQQQAQKNSDQCRPYRFTLGSREFDPKKVGFVSKDATKYPGLFIFDTSLPGNGNQGHEYVTGKTPIIMKGPGGKPLLDENGNPKMELQTPITDEERWALVEFLKTL
ncbi:di-heme-cytochrome C peroxidase [Teredinibacter sp. KSP-S5-2]|uniref:di-heme-cytochrome C peroxidase n=1 Tax=Teredinibacter sp. KSP-S5-2 TaxID=3034506 RepID=UPI002934DF27|nr:di-heme-cytochrome C peroxidase [Teredinibacter sp. KSP-S5-2]WNO09543.1 di-heme-cytochrome C peroxidase [Teredinibacter sp. KSP-S5-2]